MENTRGRLVSPSEWLGVGTTATPRHREVDAPHVDTHALRCTTSVGHRDWLDPHTAMT